MNSFRSFQEDDEDDTHLFTEAEQYVLTHHPNPDRVGCPGPATLSRFVESPAEVDLAEMNDLHVMHCAECTRDLMELRRERQRRLEANSVSSIPRRTWAWASLAVAASLVLVMLSMFLVSRNKPNNSGPALAQQHAPVQEFIDLSGDGVSRGVEDSTRPAIALPAQPLDVRLRLPYFSPSGTYRVFLAKERDLSSAVMSVTTSAVVNGPKTDLQFKFDLSRVTRGSYFLATQRLEHDPPYFYTVTIN